MSQDLPPYFIYIHGFKSSPASFKARYLAEFLGQHGWPEQYFIPELDYRPAVAIQLLEESIEQRRMNFNITLIGSSLGGYYATFLTEKFGVKSVLINPAVAPYQMMAKNLGLHQNYHTQQEYEVTQQEVQELANLEINEVTKPDKYLVLLQTGDETLDYRDAEQKYARCNPVIEQGGSHGFDDFESIVPKILAFADMKIN